MRLIQGTLPMDYTIPGTAVVVHFQLDPNGNVILITIPYGPDAPQEIGLNPSVTVTSAETLAVDIYNALTGG